MDQTGKVQMSGPFNRFWADSPQPSPRDKPDNWSVVNPDTHEITDLTASVILQPPAAEETTPSETVAAKQEIIQQPQPLEVQNPVPSEIPPGNPITNCPPPSAREPAQTPAAPEIKDSNCFQRIINFLKKRISFSICPNFCFWRKKQN